MHNNKDRECAAYFKSREEYRRCSGSSGKNGAPTEGQPGKSRCTALQKKNAAQSAGLPEKYIMGKRSVFLFLNLRQDCRKQGLRR